MKNIKKISALIMALILVLSLTATAFAADLTGGKIGSGGTSVTAITDEKINIQKELTAYNVDETNTVHAPTIGWTYSISAGSQNKQVTDSTGVSALTHQGVLTGLKVKGSTDGTAHAAVTYSSGASVSDSISWTTAATLNTSPTGAANYQNLELDFSGVDFGAAGIYRYVITEALDTTTYTSYAASGVTETFSNNNTSTTASHVRYLDVYVADGSSTTGADAWDVYGVVCFYNDNDISGVSGSDTTGAAAKTNGFVAGTTDGTTPLAADSYYTFNVTVSKSLSGDVAKQSHKFPMTVDFTNATVTNSVLLNATTSGTVTDYSHVAAPASSLDGIAQIAHNSSIKYIGIPCGTSVTVFETNDVTGTTYNTTITTDGTAGTAKSISWGTAPTLTIGAAGTGAEATDTTSAAYESNTATVSTTANTIDNTTGRHTIAVANQLIYISPTGVVLRVAPYMLMLAAGLFLVLFTRRRRKDEEEYAMA